MTSLNPVFRIGAQLDEVIALHDGEGKTPEDIKACLLYTSAELCQFSSIFSTSLSQP